MDYSLSLYRDVHSSPLSPTFLLSIHSHQPRRPFSTAHDGISTIPLPRRPFQPSQSHILTLNPLTPAEKNFSDRSPWNIHYSSTETSIPALSVPHSYSQSTHTSREDLFRPRTIEYLLFLYRDVIFGFLRFTLLLSPN
jgi:hypothetical protein